MAAITTPAGLAACTTLHTVAVTAGTLTLARAGTPVAAWSAGSAWSDLNGIPLPGLTVTATADLAFTATAV